MTEKRKVEIESRFDNEKNNKVQKNESNDKKGNKMKNKHKKSYKS